MKAEAISAVRKRDSSDLSTRDWQQLEPLLVVRRRGKWPLAEVVNAVLYILKNGCVWRDLPGDLPPWGTVYWYFAKWEADGTWQRVSTCLNVSSSVQIVDCQRNTTEVCTMPTSGFAWPTSNGFSNSANSNSFQEAGSQGYEQVFRAKKGL